MSTFAQAAATVPEPIRVFGTPLRPFCLGHHLLFKRMGLPFAGSPMAEASEEQLHIGIALCGQSYEATLEQFLNGEWPHVFSRWQRDLAIPWWKYRPHSRKQFKALLEKGYLWFRAYLQDGYQKAPVLEDMEVKGGMTLSAPWELILKNTLIRSGYSESEIMSGYLPGRWYDYYTVHELEAAQKCTDAAKWKPVFFTKEDADKIAALKALQESAGEAC